ncbi:hypothetical protein B0I35DRAFT_413103 [Stachybotrys elegans]|uniref:Uncharacterized protein n=1 Tax=Stachybotrys elegans TaxID=80388 RepID=A0A8K0SHM9_9HYPO|nr:hypothetical protein B0I35DRAFT_413103 [Stachybotrys elegans]
MCIGTISCQVIYPHHHVWHLRTNRQHRDLSKPEPLPYQAVVENPIPDLFKFNENDVAWFYRACCIFLAEDMPDAAVPRMRDMPSTFFLHFVLDAMRNPIHPHVVALLGGLIGGSMCEGNRRVEAHKNSATLNLSYRFYRTLLRTILHLPGEPRRRDTQTYMRTLRGTISNWDVHVYDDMIDEDKWHLMKFVGDMYDYHLYDIGSLIKASPGPSPTEHTDREATPYMALLPHTRPDPRIIPQPPIQPGTTAGPSTPPIFQFQAAPQAPGAAPFIGPPRPPYMARGGRLKGKDRKIAKGKGKAVAPAAAPPAAASPAASSPDSSVVFTPESSTAADSPGSDLIVFTPESSSP